MCRYPRIRTWLLTGILDASYWFSSLVITDPRKRDLVARVIIYSSIPSVWLIRNWLNRRSLTRIAHVKAQSSDEDWYAWLHKRHYASRWPPSLRVYTLVLLGSVIAYTNMVYVSNASLRTVISCALTGAGYGIVWRFGYWLDAANRTEVLCVEAGQQSVIPISSH